ncbi:MAG TPA: 50S ribosomal protein L17 [Acholeplasma sp.]|jgi:large subunit ribosomal protein L17|nr:50S ribosomal protein L17 [Acholeplasma sp.]
MARGYSKLGRTSSQRKALMRDLVTDLIINEKIETTLTKAKELRRLADRMVTLGKQNTLASRRKAASIVRFEYTDEEKNEFALQKLFNTIAPRYQDRNGGYTRVLKLMPRQGDNAPMAIIEFV